MAEPLTVPLRFVPAEKVEEVILRLCGAMHVDPGRFGSEPRHRLLGHIGTGQAGRFDRVTLAFDAQPMVRDGLGVRSV